MFHICRTIQRHFSLCQVKLCIGHRKYKQKFTTQGRKEGRIDWPTDQASKFALAHLTDHVYYWHPQSSVDRYWRSTRFRHLIDILVDPRLTHGRHLGRQTFNFHWHSIEWRSILAMTTHWYWSTCQSLPYGLLSVECWSSVNDVSVVCWWCILRSIPPQTAAFCQIHRQLV